MYHNKGCTFGAFNKYDNRQLCNDIAAIHRQCESESNFVSVEKMEQVLQNVNHYITAK